MPQITELDGIGKKRAQLLKNLDINTVEDLLYFFPRGYEDRSKITAIGSLTQGDSFCVKARIFSPIKEIRVKRSMTIYSARAADDT